MERTATVAMTEFTETHEPPQREWFESALSRLGVDRLALIVFDACLPQVEGLDIGIGTPYSALAREVFAFARARGFNAVQFGPQGALGPGNASPYDGTAFSRNPASLALDGLCTAPGDGGLGLLSRSELERTVGGPDADETRSRHAQGWQRADALLAAVHRAHVRAGSPLSAQVALFADQNRHWLEADGLYDALSEWHGALDHDHWHGPEAELDRHLFAGGLRGDESRIRTHRLRFADRLSRHALEQYLVHRQHAELQSWAGGLGLELYGDLTVGCSRRDAWHFGSAFLDGYYLGAPPSRTNREGQPWGYPVLDPDQYRLTDGSLGPALQLIGWRVEKTFREYDRVRIDHPHGLVCPWVYLADGADAHEAVRAGARLFSSPDLADHPGLARFSHVGTAQIRRDRPRHADDWIDRLSPPQVRAFGEAFEVVASQARRAGGVDRLICEVLSTQPRELQSVLEGHGLGRFRVTQKARPRDASDVYRSDRARPEDWVLMGNHDTPSIWSAIRKWSSDGTRRARAEYLAARLAPSEAERETLTRTLSSDDFELAHAELADLFLSRSRSVMLSFVDLFGFALPYNTPGTIGDHNWSLRLPRDYRLQHADLLRRRRAISVEKSLRMALQRVRDPPPRP